MPATSGGFTLALKPGILLHLGGLEEEEIGAGCRLYSSPQNNVMNFDLCAALAMPHTTFCPFCAPVHAWDCTLGSAIYTSLPCPQANETEK